MSSILIYRSETGFTKKYVDSLERRIVDLEVVPFKKAKWNKLKKYDFIFYGAPLRNNKILGINKLLSKYEKIKNKNIFIFATGIEPIKESKKENVILSNGLELYHVRLYLLNGGMDLTKLSKIKRKLIKTLLMNESKKENINNINIDLIFNRVIDNTNMNELDKMINVYHSLKLKKEA